MDYVKTKVDSDLELKLYRGKWSDKSTSERLDVIDPMLRFNVGVLTGVVFPGTPIHSLYQGSDPSEVLGQTIGSAMTTWLIAQSMGATIPLGGIAAARGPVFSTVGRAASSVLTPAIPIATAVYGTEAFIGFHKDHEPIEPTHQPSYWNSIAAALGGTFGGINLG